MSRIFPIALSVAVLVLTMVQSSDGQPPIAQTATPRYAMHAVGLDGAKSIAWIIDLSSGKVKACGVIYGGPKPECTPEDH
jgi:hypothetical protein